MIDREKVLNDLQELCEHLFHEYKICYKGDEEDTYNRFLIANNALNLLKEQEPVKPVVNVDEWVCGCCGLSVEQQRMIHPGAIFHDFFEYCPHCGKKVDWKAVRQND